jgi:aspartyl-tRNA(Asn)/glutamyl-tRNA(Gln) amidotransferase subunit A
MPIPAPPLGAESMLVDGTMHVIRPLTLRLTQLFNVSGHPAVSLPCGPTSEGLPCGLQLVGKRLETGSLMSVALTCESHLNRELLSAARR